MATHTVVLPPELNSFLAEQIAAGKVKDASCFMTQALLDQQEYEVKLSALRQAIGEGDASEIYEGDAFEDARLLLIRCQQGAGCARSNPPGESAA